MIHSVTSKVIFHTLLLDGKFFGWQFIIPLSLGAQYAIGCEVCNDGKQ